MKSLSNKSKFIPYLISAILIVIVIIVTIFIFLQKTDDDYKQKLNDISITKSSDNDSIFKEGEKIIENIKDKNSAVKEITNFYKSWAGFTYNLGKVDTSVILIEKALSVNPNDVILLTKLGFYLFHTGKNDLAIANWKKAINIDNAFTQPYVNLITYYLRENFNVDSLFFYVKSLQKVDPTYPISKVVQDTLKYYKKID